MEPQNTVADVRGDKAIIITNSVPTISASLLQELLALSLSSEVHTTFLGGGFGRRVEVDYCIDVVSKAVGAPVKMVWVEDDMMHDSYRPASMMKLTMGLDSKGMMSAFRFHSTSPSISSRLFLVS